MQIVVCFYLTWVDSMQLDRGLRRILLPIHKVLYLQELRVLLMASYSKLASFSIVIRSLRGLFSHKWPASSTIMVSCWRFAWHWHRILLFLSHADSPRRIDLQRLRAVTSNPIVVVLC